LDSVSEKAPTKAENGDSSAEKSKKKRKSTKKASKKSSKKAKVEDSDSEEEEEASSSSSQYTFTSQALSALQEASEIYLVEAFERARYVAKYKHNRELLLVSDMKVCSFPSYPFFFLLQIELESNPLRLVLQEVNREFITSIKSLSPQNGKEFTQFVKRYTKN